MIRTARAIAAALLVLLVAAPAPAQRDASSARRAADDRQEHLRRASQLEHEAVAAFNRREFELADAKLKEAIELRPGNHALHYNLACTRAQLGDPEGAEDQLFKAIQYGFDNIYLLAEDKSLRPIAGGELYQDLLASWPDILWAQHNANITSNKKWLRGKTEDRSSEKLRLELISAHDATSTDAAMEELTLLGDWAAETLFDDFYAEARAVNDPWVVVALPEKRDFVRWVAKTFGGVSTGNYSAIGGAYDHDEKTLVAQDLGATLRHEFMHALHWRDMTRRAQRHPIWIQEGLCALVEDYDLDAQGNLIPVPSWRTNMVKRLADVGRLPTIESTAGKSQSEFAGKRPLAQYAQARTIFLFLADKGKLDRFYATYVDTYTADSTGLTALRRVLGMEQNELEQAYRQYVLSLPEIPETGSDLDVTLGIDLENGAGDGPVVVGLPGRARSRTGLNLNAVITAINGRPTRDLNELLRVIGSYQPGEVVTLSYRRGKLHGTTDVELLPRG